MSNVVIEPRAPFPYFGGKRNAAQIVWDVLGDVPNYVEPFCGSCAILLARPATHAGGIETVNDADGMLVNVWRSIRNAPDEVAHECAIPVMEIELHARLATTKARMTPDFKAWMEADEGHYDAHLAANWLYCTCASIGECWGDDGPWHIVEEADGETYLRNTRELPHLGDAGQGINRKLPHLGGAGQGDEGIGPKEASVLQYLRALARRLEKVRICCGDWRRVVSTPTTIFAGCSTAGIFLDPPYTVGTELYAEAQNISGEVREWCKTAPRAARIALCGFEADGHDELLALGWTRVQGISGGSGYNTDKTDCKRERIWLSPSCLREFDLFDHVEESHA